MTYEYSMLDAQTETTNETKKCTVFFWEAYYEIFLWLNSRSVTAEANEQIPANRPIW